MDFDPDGYDGPSMFVINNMAARRRANELLDDRDPDYIQPPEDEEQEDET